MPQGCEYIWAWWQELCEGLDSSGMGAPRITWTALRDWQACTHAACEPWEIDCIRAIHAEWTDACQKAQKRK